ncbi:hypothetical protein GCM10010435_59410 [Winogradskya consettensis]|uniref:Uncharacterized protein n=1 Tax=Winogradskya consettensis TaxID=113560 RepID=A0A919VPR9_9ACTN|nr:hypothetical protein Aco04nite_38870 [Actinoplanes consettensis]
MTRQSTPVVQEPTDQPYGIRDCAFRDPAGALEITQPKSTTGGESSGNGHDMGDVAALRVRAGSKPAAIEQQTDLRPLFRRHVLKPPRMRASHADRLGSVLALRMPPRTLVPKVVRRADARVEKRKLIMGSFLYLHGCGGTVNSCGGSR